MYKSKPKTCDDGDHDDNHHVLQHDTMPRIVWLSMDRTTSPKDSDKSIVAAVVVVPVEEVEDR